MNLYREWGNFSQSLQKSKEMVEQLSKLYIIIHENVRAMMKKCSVDPTYQVRDDANQNLQFIKDVLLRCSERQHDEYLKSADRRMIVQYEQQLFSLVEQIEATLITQSSKANLNIRELMRVKETSGKQKHGLKDQLVQSNQRRIRSKSGQRSSQLNNKEKDVSESDTQIPEEEKLLEDLEQYKRAYSQKKDKLEKEIKGQVEYKNSQVFFGNKYKDSNLQNYLRERKQFADLVFAQDYYDRAIRSVCNDLGQESKEQAEGDKNKREDLKSKLFVQFKIKTKFMKESIKNNILRTLVDAKKELLEDCHINNMQKIRQSHQKDKITLRVQGTVMPTKKTVAQRQSTGKKIIHKTVLNLPCSTVRYTMASSRSIPKIYESVKWSKQIEKEYNGELQRMLSVAKIPN